MPMPRRCHRQLRRNELLHFLLPEESTQKEQEKEAGPREDAGEDAGEEEDDRDIKACDSPPLIIINSIIIIINRKLEGCSQSNFVLAIKMK